MTKQEIKKTINKILTENESKYKISKIDTSDPFGVQVVLQYKGFYSCSYYNINLTRELITATEKENGETSDLNIFDYDIIKVINKIFTWWCS